jgi:hypothetical protein
MKVGVGSEKEGGCANAFTHHPTCDMYLLNNIWRRVVGAMCLFSRWLALFVPGGCTGTKNQPAFSARAGEALAPGRTRHPLRTAFASLLFHGDQLELAGSAPRWGILAQLLG